MPRDPREVLKELEQLHADGKRMVDLPHFKPLPKALADHPSLSERGVYKLIQQKPLSLDDLTYTLKRIDIDTLIELMNNGRGSIQAADGGDPLVVHYKGLDYVYSGNHYLCLAMMSGYNDLSLSYVDADQFEDTLVQSAGKPKRNITKLSDVVTKMDMQDYLIHLINQRKMSIMYKQADLNFKRILDRHPITNDPKFDKYVKTRMVSLDDLIPIQRDVKVNTLLDILRSPGLESASMAQAPFAVKYLDKYYIYNGHHRVWLLHQLGYDELPMEVLDVDRYDADRAIRSWNHYWQHSGV